MDRQIESVDLGIDTIDDEHRHLMTLLNKFEKCVRARTSPELALSVLREALAYGNMHIEHEEQLMAAAGYPRLEEHKLHHRTARLRYTTLMSDTFAIVALDPETIKHLETIQSMIRQHIDGPDRELAAYLKAQQLH